MIKKIVLILPIFLLIILLVLGLYQSKFGLVLTTYRINTDMISEKMRLVQITDLHDSIFGTDNYRLVAKTKSVNPDIIFITGDLVNSKNGEDTSIAVSVIQQLSEIAPVYFSYGNQEKSLEESYNVDIRTLFSDAGAIVLDSEYIDIELNGNSVRIGGIYGYCVPWKYCFETNRENESEFLRDFQNTNRMTLLMCHMPCDWVASDSLYDWNVDVVFSGHVHGGQIQIPFIGGLYAPDQGWFPGKEYGIYETTEEQWNEYWSEIENSLDKATYDTSYYQEPREYHKSTLVLSRGLGNTDWIPRFNNIPEIVVVDLLPETS